MSLLLRALPAAALAFYAGAVLLGMLGMLGDAPPALTPAFVAPASSPGAHHNLAGFRQGGRVAVSSAFFNGYHYPLYLIDEEPAPTRREKWMPRPSDPAPWVELRLPRPAEIDTLVLDFASARERGVGFPRAFELRCWSSARGMASAPPRRIDNRERHARVAVDCRGMDRVRLGFEVAHNLRLYEVQALGRWSAP